MTINKATENSRGAAKGSGMELPEAAGRREDLDITICEVGKAIGRLGGNVSAGSTELIYVSF